MITAVPISRQLLMQLAICAWSLLLASAGSNSAARIAMIAITTSNSISVNPSAGDAALKSENPVSCTTRVGRLAKSESNALFAIPVKFLASRKLQSPAPCGF